MLRRPAASSQQSGLTRHQAKARHAFEACKVAYERACSDSCAPGSLPGTACRAVYDALHASLTVHVRWACPICSCVLNRRRLVPSPGGRSVRGAKRCRHCLWCVGRVIDIWLRWLAGGRAPRLGHYNHAHWLEERQSTSRRGAIEMSLVEEWQSPKKRPL